MKSAACFLCLLGIAAAEVESASGDPDAVRARIATTLHEEFAFKPPPPEPAASAAAAPTDVTRLPRFEVRDTFTTEIDRAFRRDRERREAQKFNWRDGGTLLQRGRMKVELKYDAKMKGFRLFDLAW